MVARRMFRQIHLQAYLDAPFTTESDRLCPDGLARLNHAGSLRPLLRLKSLLPNVPQETHGQF